LITEKYFVPLWEEIALLEEGEEVYLLIKKLKSGR
jgi:hypothetical protein